MRNKHPQAASRKPQGQITRGKTANNRLRRVDNFVSLYAPELLTRRDGAFARAFFVDLGYGAQAATTLESAERFRRLNPVLPVLGVEIDPDRVAAAQPYAGERTFFRLGGFNLPLRTWPDGLPETVRLIRAFNVLRQYNEDAVVEAHARLAGCLLPGGLLVEGTSDPFGRVWTANILRRPVDPAEPARLEALVFSTSFKLPFEPGIFQPVLPKNYIHRMETDEPVARFFRDWKRAALETMSLRAFGVRQWFAAGAEVLARRGYKINLRRRWLVNGYLIWYYPGG